jgi:hypothetical protein
LEPSSAGIDLYLQKLLQNGFPAVLKKCIKHLLEIFTGGMKVVFINQH